MRKRIAKDYRRRILAISVYISKAIGIIMGYVKRKNKYLIAGFIIVGAFTIIGAVRLNTNKAQSYQSLVVGVNFSAGWADHSDTDNIAIIDKLAAAGIKQVRIDIGWSTIEEAGDVYGGASDPTATYNASAPLNQWYVKKIDKAVNYANSKGIKVLGIWWTTPAWARDGGATGTNYQVRPAGYPTYPEYAESIEWAAKYWAGRIDDWEIWNEADPSQKFWQAPDGTYGGTQQYAELLKVAYPAAKRGNPNVRVVTSGPASLDDTWISQLYGYGIKGYFDVLAVHAYEGPSNADPLASNGSQKWNFLHLPAVRQVMVSNGDDAKPIWITEMGWSSHTNENLVVGSTVASWNLGVSEQQQGDYLVKAIDYAKKNWPYVEVLVHYMDRNRASASGDANTARHQMNFGLLYADNTPKPSYETLAQYLKSQASATKIGDINGDNNVGPVDLSMLLSNWGTNNVTADVNKDGIVGPIDLSLLLSNWGR